MDDQAKSNLVAENERLREERDALLVHVERLETAIDESQQMYSALFEKINWAASAIGAREAGFMNEAPLLLKSAKERQPTASLAAHDATVKAQALREMVTSMRRAGRQFLTEEDLEITAEAIERGYDKNA